MLGGLLRSLRSFFVSNYRPSRMRPSRTWQSTLRGECLERRELLSANQITYQPTISAVVIEGTSGADLVSVSTDANNMIRVTMQNSTGVQNVAFAMAGVTQIRFIFKILKTKIYNHGRV